MNMSLLVEIAQKLAIVAGLAVSIFTAIKLVNEFKNSNIEKAKLTSEKARENRHKQASAAKQILDEIFGSERARQSMQMLDWSGRIYSDGKNSFPIKFDELGPALRTTNLRFMPNELLIRDCFEHFFDKIEILQHFIEIDYINFSDINVPLRYYARIIVSNESSFFPFLEEYGYDKAKDLLIRMTAKY